MVNDTIMLLRRNACLLLTCALMLGCLAPGLILVTKKTSMSCVRQKYMIFIKQARESSWGCANRSHRSCLNMDICVSM